MGLIRDVLNSVKKTREIARRLDGLLTTSDYATSSDPPPSEAPEATMGVIERQAREARHWRELYGRASEIPMSLSGVGNSATSSPDDLEAMRYARARQSVPLADPDPIAPAGASDRALSLAGPLRTGTDRREP